MSPRRKHFALRGTGDALKALCGYEVAEVGGPGDPRRDRFSTSEDQVTCAFCRDELDRSVEAYLKPQQSTKVRIGCRHPLQVGAIERAPFATWRSLLRVIVALEDAGAPIRSTSDLDRQAAPIGTMHQGDLAQRQVERVVVAKRLLDASCAEIEQRLMVLLVVGRPVERSPSGPRSQGGRDVRLKSRLIVRVPTEPADYESIGIQSGSVLSIVRVAARRWEGFIDARGLVEQCDPWLTSEEVDMSVIPWDLKGWEEIADALGVSRRQAQLWESRGLPVVRYGRSVRASSKTLRAWSETIARASLREIAR